MKQFSKKLARYVVTGGAAAVVDLGGFVLLIGTGVPLPTAAASSFSMAVVVNYGLTSRFVFAHAMSPRTFGLFAVSALIGLSVNVAVTTAGATLLGLLPSAAKVVGIGVAFFFNFAMSAGVTFRKASGR